MDKDEIEFWSCSCSWLPYRKPALLSSPPRMPPGKNGTEAGFNVALLAIAEQGNADVSRQSGNNVHNGLVSEVIDLKGCKAEASLL